MNILLASSEVHPYSKTGGLADMVGSLGKVLARAGHRVGLVTPLFPGIRERCSELKRLGPLPELPLGIHAVRGEVWTLEPVSGLTIYSFSNGKITGHWQVIDRLGQMGVKAEQK